MKKSIIYLLVITLFAGFLRFYKLGSYPTLTVDAAAVGYNAYSILKTGRDEFGVKFPVFFKSFGEGKLPLYVYEAVIPVAIFGLNVFSARFATALLATLTIPVLYFFTIEVLKFSKISNKNVLRFLPLSSAFVLATMPWHIQLSREIFGQESLFWVLLGSYFSLKFLNKEQLKFWIYSLVSFSAGLMTYHAAKAFVPLWIIYILFVVLRKSNFKKVIRLGVIALVLSGSVWIWMSSSKLGETRAKDVSVFSKNNNVAGNLWRAQIVSQNQPVIYTRFLHNKPIAYGKDILLRYFAHFDPILLFFEGNIENERIRVPYVGLVLLIGLPFFYLGLYFLINRKLWPVLIFLLLSPIASSLTYGGVNAVRSVYMSIAIATTCSLGLIEFYGILKIEKVNKFVKGFAYIFLLLFFIQNFLLYLNSYYVHQNYFYAKEWQYETRQVVDEITKIKNNYENVYITRNMGGNPYIYFLFYNKYDPKKWQEQANNDNLLDRDTSFIHITKMDNINFFAEDCINKSEDLKANSLYLCKAGNIPDDLEVIKEFKWPDGTDSFVLGKN